MPTPPKPESRLVALFVLGLLLFNFPLLAVFNNGGMIGGIPVGFLYVFGAWAALIALLAATVRPGG